MRVLIIPLRRIYGGVHMDKKEMYYVKRLYIHLLQPFLHQDLISPDIGWVLHLIWKSYASSKSFLENNSY